ncbi:hypothetical protein ACMHYB_23445 [Sorangium sp. So ce1128]
MATTRWSRRGSAGAPRRPASAVSRTASGDGLGGVYAAGGGAADELREGRVIGSRAWPKSAP